jgi:hypothetical protein
MFFWEASGEGRNCSGAGFFDKSVWQVVPVQQRAGGNPAGVEAQAELHEAAGFAVTPELLELLVTREMPFGKYKGRLIADLPGHYLAWFAREGFPKGQLGQLLALMHELDHNDLRALVEPLRKRPG